MSSPVTISSTRYVAMATLNVGMMVEKWGSEVSLTPWVRGLLTPGLMVAVLSVPFVT